MTRIDMQGPSAGTPLRETVMGGLQRERRGRFWGCGGCLSAFLFACALAAFAAVWIIAKVGTLHVPFLSEAVYHPSGPVRDVQPLSGYSQADVLRTLGARTQRNPVSGELSTVMSEEELTTIVAKGIRDAHKEGDMDLTGIQVAITAKGLEFSANASSSGGKSIPVVVRALPRVKEHAFALDVDRLAIGSLEIPQLVTSFFVAAFGDAALHALNNALAGVGTLQRITLQEGKMEVALSPN